MRSNFSRELANRGVDIARARIAENHRLGQLRIGRQVGPRQRSGEALFDQRLETRLAVFADGDLGAELRAGLLPLELDVGVGGIQLGGELILDERLFEVPGRGQSTRVCEVVL